jgi:acyl-CoA reductase-like NAD-dependent aldehyde dehydrogenase
MSERALADPESDPTGTWAVDPARARRLIGRVIVLARRAELLDLIQLECGKARAHAFEEIADVAVNARSAPSAGCGRSDVAADADLDRAAEGVVRDCFSSAGQLCVSIERLVLHEAVADAFLDRFLDRVRRLRLVAGLDYSPDMGSLVSPEQLARVQAHVEDAVARGGTVLAGGRHRPDVGPLLFEPTVLEERDGVRPQRVHLEQGRPARGQTRPRRGRRHRLGQRGLHRQLGLHPAAHTPTAEWAE